MGVRSASWVQLKNYSEEKVVASVWKTENMAIGIRCTDHAPPLSAKVGINLADKQRLLNRHRSITVTGHGVSFFFKHLFRDWMLSVLRWNLLCWPPSPVPENLKIGTSFIYWAKLSRCHLTSETESSLQNVAFQLKTGWWIMSRNTKLFVL
jgi:hypothetical protein